MTNAPTANINDWCLLEYIPNSAGKRFKITPYTDTYNSYTHEAYVSIDGNTVFEPWKLISADLIANELIKLTSYRTLYVTTTGSDTSGDGTSAKPFATIQKALDSVPKNLGNNDVRVYIGAGTYAGFNIIGFRNGVLKIIGGANLTEATSYNINSSISIYNCDLRRMDISSINTTSNIVVNNSNCVILDGVNISNTDKNSVGFIGQYNSNITIVISNISSVVAELGSYISIWNTTGTGNDVAVYAGGTSGSS